MTCAINVNGHFVKVDPEDVPLCLSLKLRIVNKTRHKKIKLYVEHCDRVNGHHVHASLHRMILGVTDPTILVDHRDGDGLNCKRSNLRETNHAGNSQNASRRADNTSGYRGVTFNKLSGKWQASIQREKVKKHLGLFPTAELAHEAYATAARELHGEFAKV